jgi:FHS family glucose/mannose:H+ symporter-like MFS transporter
LPANRSAPALATDNAVNPVRTLLPVFLYFIAAGIATVMLGPLLPSLIQRWHIQDAQAGTLFTASFVGQFCGAWFATRNLRASIVYGSAITAAGCAAMAWVGFGLAHIALLCIGLGLGAGLTAGNVIAGTAVPSARARLIAMLNVAWGVGAIACPVLVRLSTNHGLHLFFFTIAASLAVTALISIAIPRMSQPLENTDSSSGRMQGASRLPLPPPLLFIFSAAVFLYVGVENALGGWLPSYAVRTNPALLAPTIAIYFWIAELVGRLLVTMLMTFTTEAVLYRVCLALLIFAQLLLCITAQISSTSIITLTILTALSLAPLYPIILSFLLARTGSHPDLGALLATAAFGGATLPWLTGVVSTHFHGLRAGLLVPAVGSALLLFLSAVITTKTPMRKPQI